MSGRVKLSIRPGDIERVQQRKLTPALTEKPLAELFRDASDFALREAQTGAGDLGGIARSLTASVGPAGVKITSNHPGAMVHEFGRRAGGRMPPPDALARYGEATFALARFIAERGWKGRFFVTKARVALQRSELPRQIEAAKQKIEARWKAA